MPYYLFHSFQKKKDKKKEEYKTKKNPIYLFRSFQFPPIRNETQHKTKQVNFKKLG